MSSEGHEIGGHSWDHRQLTKLGEQELTDQIMNTRAKIYDVTGVDPVLMRPPYGSCNKTVKAKAKELGVAMINWSVDTLDWAHTPPEVIAENVLSNAEGGDIILFHDYISGESPTPAALRMILPVLLERGYEFVTVSELIGGEEETKE